MININIKATGIELTPALKTYVQEKMKSLGKFIDARAAVQADVEIGQTTHHHHSGQIFRCEINLTLNGDLLRVDRQEGDLYAAIDVAKDELLDQVRSHKDKKTKTERRGARMFKGFLQKFGFGNGEE
jgi:ribosomal subunit interface protein